jgi:small subunit ribosomal protein S6
MRKYESMIVLDPDLTPEDAEKENTAILELIRKEGGEPLETEAWGKRRLAYEINKKREGYYFINWFNFPADRLHELERHYNLSENFLRHNLLVVEE